MRAIQTASKWGNMYNFRYFADGVRVTEWMFKHLLAEMEQVSYELQNTKYGFRRVYILK